MPVLFDSRYESDKNACELIHKCRGECKSDMYLIGGIDRTLPIMLSNEKGRRIDGYIADYFPDRDIYTCHNLDIYRHNHIVEPVGKEMKEEMDKNGSEDAVLFGGSYGGMVAQEVASEYPDAVDKVILAFSTDYVPWDDKLELDESDIYNIGTRMLATRLGELAVEIMSENEGVGGTEDIVNFYKFDHREKNKDITADVFVLNCLNDNFVGRIPEIDGMTRRINTPCVHHQIAESDLVAIKEFVDG